jgi:hypothetical protein
MLEARRDGSRRGNIQSWGANVQFVVQLEFFFALASSKV